VIGYGFVMGRNGKTETTFKENKADFFLTENLWLQVTEIVPGKTWTGSVSYAKAVYLLGQTESSLPGSTSSCSLDSALIYS
jgi:hypothetical protein